MQKKIPVLLKVHAWGKGFNDSFWIQVFKDLTFYTLYTLWPDGTRQKETTGPRYDIMRNITRLLGEFYENEQVDQMNLTWFYDDEAEEVEENNDNP